MTSSKDDLSKSIYIDILPPWYSGAEYLPKTTRNSCPAAIDDSECEQHNWRMGLAANHEDDEHMYFKVCDRCGADFDESRH